MGSVGENIRTGKTQKSIRRLPRRVGEMSKEVLEATLIKKRDCNTKALQIVERLVENTVDEHWFLDCLKFISDSHYQDVIEERAITKLCGYPLCSRKLKDIPNQQYHISTKLNKVYDITERKNFCSNQCYQASTYLKRQLLTSPLWLRDNEETPKFLLIPVHSGSGGVGEEIDIGQCNPLKDKLKQLHKPSNSNDFISVSDFMKDSLSKLSSDIDKSESKNKNGSSEASKRKDENNTQKKDIKHTVSEESGVMSQSHNESKQNCERDQEKLCTDKNITVTHEIVQLATQNPQDNSTLNSKQSSVTEKETTDFSKQISLEHDTEKLKESVSDGQSKNAEVHTKEVDINDTAKIESTSSIDVSVRKKHTKSKKNKESKKKLDFTQPVTMTSAVIHVEKCLHEWFTFESMCFLFGEEKMKEMVSDKGECIKEYYKVVNNASWDPKVQEQYLAICRRLHLMEIEENKFENNTLNATKPVSDYEAIKNEVKKMDLKVRAFFQGKSAHEVINTDESNVAPNVLPIVDLHAQKCLRRKIVRDRLNRVVPDILRTFGLPCDVTKDVRNLVATFSLEAHNISFQPLEWNLIGMIIIKMLSIRDMRLQILLDNEDVTKYITMMLMVFQQDGGYLDRLMAWLTDLDNLIRKQ